MKEGTNPVCASSEALNRGQFQKGVSGNPGGRPKMLLADGRSLAEVARAHTSDAVAVLVEVMEDRQSPAASRVAAAVAVLDRGWGRPTQDLTVGSPVPSKERELSAMENEHRIQSLIGLALSRRAAMQRNGELLPGGE